MSNTEQIDFFDSAAADRPMSFWARSELFLISLVVHALALALPLALLQIYDRILPNQSTGTVAFLALGVGVAIALEAVLRYGRARVLASVGARFDAQVPVVMVKRLLAADLGATDRRGSAALLESFRSLATVRDFWSGNAAVSLYETPFVLVYVALIFYIGGQLAAIPAGIILAAGLLALAIRRSAGRSATAMERLDRRRQDLLWTLIKGLSLVKAVGGERQLASRYGTLSAASMAEGARFEALGAVLRESGAALGQISTVLVVSLGAVMVTQGELTTGGLAACSILAGRSIGPALAGLGYFVRMGQVSEAESRVRDVLTLPALARGASAQPVEDDTLTVSIDGRPEFACRRGEIVGIDADRPHAASTVLSAISGLRLEPGVTAMLGGHDVLSLAPQDLRDRIAYVPEESALLPGSILNNLTLYDPRFNTAARIEADRLGLTEHFGRLRHGMLTEIGGAAGAQLDEGLVQRIALVRAMIRKPSVLILDQADDALDLDGERRLADLLVERKAVMAIVVFSARPAIRDVCDRLERI